LLILSARDLLAFISVEEPFAGLDPAGREEVGSVLGDLTNGVEGADAMRVVLILRGGEDLPSWVTDVVEVQAPTPVSNKSTDAIGPGLRFGKNGDEKGWWADKIRKAEQDASEASTSTRPGAATADLVDGAGKEVVRMEDVNVSYGDKQVRRPSPSATSADFVC
jgi:energy-coupling factor transporter ATP-binding protein EcfA2